MDQQPSLPNGCATTTPANAIPDSECSLESSMISVIVKNTKFRLDSHFLQRESETLKGIIAASKADSICLDDATVAEFRALRRYFYEGMYDDYKPSSTEWMDLLSIANTYGFTKVYHRAVQEVDDLDGAIGPIERILLAKHLKVNRWLAPGYTALCMRTDPISTSEAEKLGVYTFIALLAARESFYRDSPLNTNPVPLLALNLRCCGYSPPQFTMNDTGGRNCPNCGLEVIRAPTSKKVATNANIRCCTNYTQAYWQEQPDGSWSCSVCKGTTVPAPVTMEAVQECALATVNWIFGLENEGKKDKKL